MAQVDAAYLDFRVPAYKPSWSTPFTTATIMVALKEAEQVGLEVNPKMLKKGVRLLHRLRTPDGNYAYSIDWKWRPKGMINRPQGSCMRNPGCNLALRLHDDKSSHEIRSIASFENLASSSSALIRRKSRSAEVRWVPN